MPSNWATGTIVTYMAELTANSHKWMLLRNSYTPNPDHKFVSDLVPATNECNVGGYVGGFGGAGRKAATSKTWVEDTANNRATLDAADPAPWTALAAGNTLRYIVLIEEITNDAASRVVACLDLQSDFITNGGDLTVALNALGIAYINC
jgi:hypothetical protein